MSVPGFGFTLLAFLIVIGPLIFVHELGHYFVGRWFGVKAEVFSIGFGREVAGWTDRLGTRWKIGWMPLGGYVRFKGDMNPASTASDEYLALPAEERAICFQAQPLWQRFLIVLAGPMTNFLFAVLAFIAIFAMVGYPTNAAIVGTVAEGSAAAQAGFRPGDKVVRVDGRRLETFGDLSSYVALRPEQRMRFEVEREGRLLALSAMPRAVLERDMLGNENRIGRLGIAGGRPEVAPVAWYRLPGLALSQTIVTIDQTIVALKQVILGSRSARELGGPLRIAKVSGQVADLGWLPLLNLMAVISISLGFINLLPIPLLDGGHLLFYAIEGIRRRPLGPQAQEWALRGGLAFLLALMVFVTFNDLLSFGLFQG